MTILAPQTWYQRPQPRVKTREKSNYEVRNIARGDLLCDRAKRRTQDTGDVAHPQKLPDSDEALPTCLRRSHRADMYIRQVAHIDHFQPDTGRTGYPSLQEACDDLCRTDMFGRKHRSEHCARQDSR